MILCYLIASFIPVYEQYHTYDRGRQKVASSQLSNSLEPKVFFNHIFGFIAFTKKSITMLIIVIWMHTLRTDYAMMLEKNATERISLGLFIMTSNIARKAQFLHN